MLNNRTIGIYLFQNTLILSILVILILISASSLHAQIDLSNLGKMTMTPKLDDEENQLLSDAMNRRVVLSPDHVIIKSTVKSVSVEMHNPTKDTLVVNLFMSDTVVGVSRFVSVESPNGKAPGKTSGKELLKQNSDDSITSIYRPMSSWIKDLPKSISLAPGERKSISVILDIPVNTAAGEYASWIVAVVEPRKKIPEVKKAVYTISNAKVTYKSESNNSESQSAK